MDDGKGALSIHFTESLKNVLLVMVQRFPNVTDVRVQHASGVFEAASKRSGQVTE